MDETKPGRVQIKDPLSGYPYNNLSWKLPKSMNLLDYRVKEISKSYRLVSTGFFVAKYPYKVYPKSFSVSAKMIFTSHLDETDDEFAVMAKFGRKNLSMWRNFDKKWTNVEMYLESSEYILDIIYHTHKFYVLISRGVTISLDSKSMTINEVPSPPEDSNSQLISLLRLVESCKDLLLIGKYRDSGETKDHFKVFKLNEERCEWLPELELEDRALVMDRDGSYSLSAKEFSGCRGNSIYFLDDYSSPKYGHPGEGVRIFDLQDGSVGELSKFPGNSHLFWPPPTWLK